MKNFVMSLVGLGVLFSLTACGTEVKTEEYYREHIDEAKARKKECRKYKEQYAKGELDEDIRIDCTNASRAVFKEELKDLGSSQGKPNPNALKW